MLVNVDQLLPAKHYARKAHENTEPEETAPGTNAIELPGGLLVQVV
jgi:hypothetical protein